MFNTSTIFVLTQIHVVIVLVITSLTIINEGLVKNKINTLDIPESLKMPDIELDKESEEFKVHVDETITTVEQGTAAPKTQDIIKYNINASIMANGPVKEILLRNYKMSKRTVKITSFALLIQLILYVYGETTQEVMFLRSILINITCIPTLGAIYNLFKLKTNTYNLDRLEFLIAKAMGKLEEMIEN